MKIYSISDMHGQLEGLDPKGMDLVLISGDFARLERLDFIGVCNQVNWVQHKFCAWCANYPQTQFRLIPGNHDIFAQELKMLDQIRWPGNVKMLIDSEDEVGGLRIYGTPWIPHINGCWAFEAPLNSSCLADRFSAIPEGLDILLTHTPPKVRHQKLDVSIDTNSPHFGSEELTEALHRAQPRIALCGHIHSGDHKPYELVHTNGAVTTIRNVSRLNEDYRIAYEPFIFEL